ncbi:DUF2312 domain-containing protein [Rhodobacter sphaeroides]|uniref:DUF2312 domain-containing protein n=1 Tax=Cereibacter sphaeroides TaxID=1063 RepID=UPI00132C8A6E|nr:DUF2312 domain-containing protein [Cereibacter sphaeroides]MWP40144.1 DUF2312 domain-containing protein [Cereibacter sphaeroides]
MDAAPQPAPHSGPVPVESLNAADLDRMAAAIDSGRIRKPPMKETPADRAVAEAAYQVAADELRQFIERFEQLEAEKKEIGGQQKELMAEAKGRGYAPKILRMIVALRKRSPDDIAEEETLLELYKAALGMA